LHRSKVIANQEIRCGIGDNVCNSDVHNETS
jgi:hypothetical protein